MPVLPFRPSLLPFCLCLASLSSGTLLAATPHHRSAAASARLTPLSRQQAAQQLLNRFTYGARPGDLAHVLSVGPAAWLEQQLHPASIDDPVLTRRLADYPTTALPPAQALALFPDAAMLRQIEAGRLPMPADPQLAAVYQVQLLKYDRREARKAEANPGSQPHVASSAGAGNAAAPAPSPQAAAPEPDAAESRPALREEAARLATELAARPAAERIPALLRLPVEQRAAVATLTLGEARTALLKGVSPADRELFLSMAGPPGSPGHLGQELAEATVLRDILSERQLEAVMTDFWFNHFNVFEGKEADRWYTATYVRDSIRPHALGHFRDLLVSTATSPAMLVYLDNWLSVGPDSPAAGRPGKGKKASRGLNENYGRELMELHTLSVDGGYTQADVTALSSILTGWTVDRPQLGGGFQFDQRRHQPGDKQWLGHTIAEGRKPDGSPDGMREGLEALDLLAQSPRTARFISTLLAQRFVADTPPPVLVDRLTSVYLSTDGDISAMLRALAASREFNSRQFFQNEVKTPLDFVASALRSTATTPADPSSLVATLRQMGMPLFGAQPPTGYYLTADHWMNSAALVDRLAFADALTAGRLGRQPFDADHLLAVALLAPGSLDGLPPGSASRFAAGETPAKSRQNPAEMRLVAADVQPSLASSAGSHLVMEVLANTLFGSRPEPSALAALEARVPVGAGALPTLVRVLLSSPEFQLR